MNPSLFQDDAAAERMAVINATMPPDHEHFQVAIEFAAERHYRQRAAIEQARYWLRQGAPGRALEVLESAF